MSEVIAVIIGLAFGLALGFRVGRNYGMKTAIDSIGEVLNKKEETEDVEEG